MTDIESDTYAALQQFIHRISEHANRAIVDIILYGSRARGDHEAESDVDVAVIVEDDGTDIERMRKIRYELIDHAYETMLALFTKDVLLRIQPLPIPKEHWDDPSLFQNPYLIQNIQQEGISVMSLYKRLSEKEISKH